VIEGNAMFTNYIKIAFRSLWKHKAYSFINVAGLAVGLSCCVLIGLFVKEELSYDRYNPKAERLYKVVMNTRTPEKESAYALSPAPMGATLVRDFPEVQSSVRLFTFFGDAVVSLGDKHLLESRIVFADSTFFDLFGIPLVAGDAGRALAEPNTIVLSESMARKYFEKTDPVGRTLRLNSDFDVRVSGVMADIPRNSHFHADFLVSMASIGMSRSTSFITNNNFHTYVLLREGASAQALEAKLDAEVKRYAAPQVAERYGHSYDERTAAGFSTSWSLVPVTDIHLHSQREYEIEPNGSITTVYIFSAIAFIVLLIACVNFVNFATARSATRAKEIGVRKVVGSNRTQLIAQFVTESVLLTFLALIIALVIVELFLPAFTSLSGMQIGTAFFTDGFWLPTLIGVALVVGLLAGAYPALYLSSLRPTAALKEAMASGGTAATVRNGLVVFQFALSVALIVGALTVQRQLVYLSNQNLGFQKDQVLVIARASSLGREKESFKQALSALPQIVSVAASNTLPGRLFGRSTYRDARAETSYALQEMDADAEFIPTLGMKIVAGRNFSASLASDSSAVILNQSAARLFGWADPVGRQLAYPSSQEKWRGRVVGVVEDFHFESLRSRIQPLVILHQPWYQYLSVRIRPDNVRATVQAIEAAWKKFAPDQPFEYSFLDKDFDALYHAEQETGTIFEIFSALTIFIACLGQLGLAAFMIEKRTKEIGVRKVLGSTVSGIVGLLSKDFVKLVLIANILAWPVAYYAMNRWLENFAYRVEISPWTFLLAGALALSMALLSVMAQAIKAALANPVEALRYE
jgi:putative ABC transport system permease protein